MTQYKKGHTMKVLTKRQRTLQVLKGLGYDTSNISEERAAVIEWVIFDSTEEQQERLLKVLRALTGGKK